jgi:50S ribosomal protein L16 3-hydroxylase
MASIDRSKSQYPLPFTTLGGISTAEFIDNYWQKKPYLIRQALPDYDSPITPDELAGLALEEEIESRLVIEHGKTPWELKHGTFTEQDFQQLPESNWTLLVQSINHWIPDFDDLLEFFRFIPNWRLDDIMASYATTGGSVGPHFDQYDVFLLQASGQRRWKIGQYCDSSTPCIEGIDLHILKQFEPADEWVLNPGDMLYLPPRLAHWGTAEDDACMTFSIGFRAPSYGDLLSDFLEEELSTGSAEQRYEDPGFKSQFNPGEISTEALSKVHNILNSQLDQPEKISRWFGRYTTRPKSDDCPTPIAINDHHARINIELEEGLYKRNPQMRFAFIPNKTFSHTEQSAYLFISGEEYCVSLSFADLLCANNVFHSDDLRVFLTSPKDKEVLAMLLDVEALYSETTDY